MNLTDIITAIKELSKKPQPYDTTATVQRVDEDGTAWVQIPGSEDETPVNMTINAREGDTVQVRISGGTAFLVGNATAPPTDDKKAVLAIRYAETAQETADQSKEEAQNASESAEAASTQAAAASMAADMAQEAANTAIKIAGNTEQHFWMTETGTDTGVHITEVTQDEFLADPANAGGNLLARSNGIAIRKGLTEVAVFNENTIEIGKNSDESTIKMLNGTLQIKVEETNGVDFCEFIGGSNIEGFSFNKTTYLTEGLEVEEPAAFYDGVTILGGNLAVSGNVQDIAGNKYTKQTNTTIWTALTESGADTVSGGYFTEGKHVYVYYRCTLKSAGTAGTNVTLATGLPEPAVYTPPLTVMVGNENKGTCWVNSSGELRLKPSAAIATNNNIIINGHYVSA